MNIKGEILRPARLSFETAKFLGSATLHALDGVMTNLYGWPRGEDLFKNHVRNEQNAITKELAERRDKPGSKPGLVELNAARLARAVQHYEEPGHQSADYKAIIAKSMTSAGYSEQEVTATLESERLQQLIDSPLVVVQPRP